MLPTFGDRPFTGPLAAARHLATQFVHSRVDGLVSAGAQAYELRIDELLATSIRMDRDDPGWLRLADRRAWWRHWPGMLG